MSVVLVLLCFMCVFLFYFLFIYPFNIKKEVLLAATNNIITLCRTESEIPQFTQRPILSLLLSSDVLSDIRSKLRVLIGPSFERPDELIWAAGEASINAIRHGSNGVLSLYKEGDCFYVKVADKGRGIPNYALIPSVLCPGYSSGRSVGLGFTIITDCCDKVWLHTSPRGTTILLQVCYMLPDMLGIFNEVL